MARISIVLPYIVKRITFVIGVQSPSPIAATVAVVTVYLIAALGNNWIFKSRYWAEGCQYSRVYIALQNGTIGFSTVVDKLKVENPERLLQIKITKRTITVLYSNGKCIKAYFTFVRI